MTLTGVTVTQDLSHAKIRVSVPGDEDAKQKALEGLRSAAGFHGDSRRDRTRA